MVIYDNKFIFEILKRQIMNRTAGLSPSENPYESAATLFWDSVCENHIMYLNKTRFPDIRGYKPFWGLWLGIYAETVMIHHLFDDNYNEENANIQQSLGIDPPYCYEDVTVEKGDAVIDAGAYIGDWAAVAAQMGGKVYAFEPCPYCHELLKHTSWLNNFQMVTDGLGDVVCKKLIDVTKGALGNTVNDTVGLPCNVTTVDQFSTDNNLHIDFIKSDIEGYERFMLWGAKRVLIEDQPKLSIRTYHNDGEDAVVLPQLIKEINPNYKIINRRNALYAYVE
jgi:FkbM family methyltransferase